MAQSNPQNGNKGGGWAWVERAAGPGELPWDVVSFTLVFLLCVYYHSLKTKDSTTFNWHLLRVY